MLHRFIINAPFGKFVDHIDGNGLNNQKTNLRLCTNSQNMMNQKMHKDNRSGYKGVRFHKSSKKWQARICINYKDIFLGGFKTAILAHEAYKKAVLKYHKEFGRAE